MHKGNLLIIHGGGPTAVLNCSLYGAVMEALGSSCVDHVLGAIHGTGGAIRKRFIDFSTVPREELERLKTTPATAIGTSRDPLEREEYESLLQVCKEEKIQYVLMNGGNGTMDACGRLAKLCSPYGIHVMGIPKTMDNDIMVTDHSPGFGSVARYMAGTLRELGQDLQSLPIHVIVTEALGRNAGWTTAASALAREEAGQAPHLLYFPERAFHKERFLEDVEEKVRRFGGVLVVASEGLRDESGKPIVPPIFQTGRSTYFGEVSSHLSQMIVQELGIKARCEKPGIFARASIAWQSKVDALEAEEVARVAVRAAIEGESGKMVALRRLPGEIYQCETFLVSLEKVMLGEKGLPDEFIHPSGNDTTQRFIDWCLPLIGEPLPRMAHLFAKEGK